MPTSFKGTELSISRVTITGRASTGALIGFEIQFRDKEGLVHAVTNHEIEATTSPRIHACAQELLDALRGWSEEIHFDDTSSPNPTRKAVRGIAESLQGGPDPSDDPGEQG